MKQRKNRIWFLSFMVLVFVGCSTTYYYSFAPTSPTTLTIAGVPGASFAVSKGGPGKEDSSFRILPLGLRQIGGARLLLVRFYFENFEPKAWRLKANLQRAKFRGTNEYVPATWTDQSPSEVQIPPGFSRVLDVLFVTPNSVQEDSDLEGLQISWAVTTTFQNMTGTTEFHRVETEEDPTHPSPAKNRKPHH